MMKHTKDSLIKDVSSDTGLSQKACKAVIDAVFSNIAALPTGQSQIIAGFGRFSAEMTKARTVRNPATGETMQTTPRRRLTFKGSKPSK